MTDKLIVKLKLLQLICYRADEGDGDEIFLKQNGKKVWPEDQKYLRVSEGTVKMNLALDIELGSQVVLELWDYDVLSPNDRLGEFRMLADQRGAEFTTDLYEGKSQAKYSLKWELT
ncbi:MAG: hypothetical protein AAGG59_06090 [Bacteroidota bacterium]